MADLDNSFDENDSIDLASVVAEFPLGDDHPDEDIKMKRLAGAFDEVNTNMKVYLRVRPFKGKEEGTIKIESDTSIVTVAPEQSKRAQYTKTESRNYVGFRPFLRVCPLSNQFSTHVICRYSQEFLEKTPSRRTSSTIPQRLCSRSS